MTEFDIKTMEELFPELGRVVWVTCPECHGATWVQRPVRQEGQPFHGRPGRAPRESGDDGRR